MRKKVLTMAVLGFVLGMTIGDGIAWLTGGKPLLTQLSENPGALLVQTLVSGLYGAATMSGTLLYDVEHWSLAKSTLVHYLIVAVPYVPMALLLGWSERAADILIVEAIQLVVFALIWLIMYTIFRRQIRELNKLREQRVSEQADGKKE